VSFRGKRGRDINRIAHDQTCFQMAHDLAGWCVLVFSETNLFYANRSDLAQDVTPPAVTQGSVMDPVFLGEIEHSLHVFRPRV